MNQIINEAAVCLSEVRAKAPLVHNITNYVTVNDCANALLALGASPIMADDIGEVSEIVALSQALVINMGTLNQRTINSMIAAGKAANQLGIPVIFDPVGAGASGLRNNTAREIVTQVKLSVVRGNISEISCLAGLSSSTKGVDAGESDAKKDGAVIAKSLAQRLGCTVAITGAVDYISDGARLAKITNGHEMLGKVTGTGCMTTSLVGATCGVTNDYYIGAVAGVAAMGLAGEIGFVVAGAKGTGSFRVALLDALSKMEAEQFKRSAKIDEE